MQWDKDSDTFVLNFKVFIGQTISEKPTKRHVVQVTSRFYVPLEFIILVTVKLKLFCQRLCKKKLDWDEELDEQTKVKWFTLLQELREAKPIEIRRCYLGGICGEVQSVSLHGFCNASVGAYAAVVYMYLKTTEGAHLKFVTAKTRVAPLVKQSISRLELLSARILARDERETSTKRVHRSCLHLAAGQTPRLRYIGSVEKRVNGSSSSRTGYWRYAVSYHLKHGAIVRVRTTRQTSLSEE